MMYQSTRDNSRQVSAAQAIAGGISPDGGLYAPCSLPTLDRARLEALVGMDYRGRAVAVLAEFLDEFAADELRECVDAAYGAQFDSEAVAPLAKLGAGRYLLELWHGPTCAFKDMALQLLPHLLTRSAQKTGGAGEIDILVATSGDTGKAALEGFRDVPGTRVLVFYPDQGVSEVQKLQMQTQEGGNVGVCAVRGNFDDTQTAVKQIFTDPSLARRLAAKNAAFSSANSINWGRLVPQIVYYVSAYCDLVAEGEIALGDTLNVAVPTGNFGNILAAYYAGQMGLPLGRLICASNKNRVLADFFSTGVYDRRREFYATSSPSMDILISSNLERLLHALSGRDDAQVADMMKRLADDGAYEVPPAMREAMRGRFWGGHCDEEDTARTIRETFAELGYLADTHTAVAIDVHQQYVNATGDDAKTVIASTASPFKFAGSILEALGSRGGGEGFAQLEELSALTGIEPPAPLLGIRDKTVRFQEVIERDAIRDFVCGQLDL